MKAIEVIEAGVLSTIQDLGRFGFQKYGVSVSGGMDKFALRVANLLVGNNEGAAVIEMPMLGPRLKLHQNIIVSFCGGNLCPQINESPAPMWRALLLKKEDIISFSDKPPESGFRIYMAVGGGIDAPLMMGSHSTHLLSRLGGIGRPLEKGDILSVHRRSVSAADLSLREDQIPAYPKHWEIRVIPGPQEDYFSKQGIDTFYSETYQITSKADRMGYRLKGAAIEHKYGADILSDATPPGSVQVPGDGMPIILLADAQTTGGYAKIGVVISPDQEKLAQAAIGDKLRFQKVDIMEAYDIIDRVEEKINGIRSHIAQGVVQS